MVLESTFDASKGSLATLLVQRGTLKKGDYAVSGTKFCRVRLMENEAGAEVEEAGPSMACQVTGFQDSPQARCPADTFRGWIVQTIHVFKLFLVI